MSSPHPRRRRRRPPRRPDEQADQRAARPAPGGRPRGQGKMPSRVRALTIGTSGSAPSSCGRAARTRPHTMINTASTQAGCRRRDFADPLGPTRVAAQLHGHRDRPVDVPSAPLTGPAGTFPQTDRRTALVAVVPLGRVTAGQAALLAANAELQITPWRSVALPDLPDASLASALNAAGLVLDAASPWLRVTACAGRAGCAKSMADVRADAATAVATATLPAGGSRQHWAGCERRCGRPQGIVVDVVATGTGYRVEKS